MDANSTMDTTKVSDITNTTQNSTIVDTTHTSSSSSLPSCSAEVDEIASVYKQQVMASSAALEAKYQAVVKESNKKLKTERSHKKNLEKELADARILVDTTKALERQLKANSLVLQSVKKELDISNRTLEKSIISERQRDHDFRRVQTECDELEKQNFDLGRSVQERSAALALANDELLDSRAQAGGLSRDLRDKEKEHEQRAMEMRNDMQGQFTEMQEDMAILVGRMQEMSAIKQKYETTEKNYATAVQENQILVDTVSELKHSLTIELTKSEALHENVTQLGRENVSFIEQIKTLDQEKWSQEASLKKIQDQLKDSRVSQLDTKRVLDKKEKVLKHMGQNLGKIEGELKTMEKMYKTKLDEQVALKGQISGLEVVQQKVEQQEREMKAMDSQIDQLESQNSVLNAKYENAEKSSTSKMAALKSERDTLERQLKSANNEHESSEVSVCELRIKIKQLTEEQVTFQAARRQFENELAEQASLREQSEHNVKRLQRKQDFLQDELDQFKSQFDKDRSKFEQATRDNINLQDQVSSLRSQLDAVTMQMHEAEHRNSKTINKSDRMKEKIKAYQKNLTDAHDEEIDQLQGTIEELKKTLNDREQAFRGSGGDGPEKDTKAKKRESYRISELEQTINQIQHKVNILESENKSLETMLESKKRPRETSPIESPVRAPLRERKSLTKCKILEDESIDHIAEAGEENKENRKPRSKAKKPDSKRARVGLSEKKNDITIAPRTTRNRAATHNKTMF